MAGFDIERLERMVRSELASQAAEPTPEAPTGRWRAMRRHAETAGSPATRALSRLGYAARFILHAIRKRRSR